MRDCGHDQLLGEGVLPTIHDARRRLLVERDPIVIPCGATAWATPVEMRQVIACRIT